MGRWQLPATGIEIQIAENFFCVAGTQKQGSKVEHCLELEVQN